MGRSKRNQRELESRKDEWNSRKIGSWKITRTSEDVAILGVILHGCTPVLILITLCKVPLHKVQLGQGIELRDVDYVEEGVLHDSFPDLIQGLARHNIVVINLGYRQQRVVVFHSSGVTN